jgi:hypothetical protein
VAEEEHLTVICSGFDRNEAWVAAQALLAQGINAWLETRNGGSPYPFLQVSTGASIVVPSHQARDAIKLVEAAHGPLHRPSAQPRLVTAFPMLLFGALLLIGSVVFGMNIARAEGFSGTVLALAGPLGAGGLMLIVAPLAMARRGARGKAIASRRSRIVS